MQKIWDGSTKRKWTHRLIRQVDRWINRRHGEVNYYLSQMLSGHGCFRAYFYKFKHEETPECPTSVGILKNTEHVFTCPSFRKKRQNLETIVDLKITPDNVSEAMLASDDGWKATTMFATTRSFRIYAEKSKGGLK